MGDHLAMILAGGASRRMQSKLTKVLHPILGEALISYVLDAARKANLAAAIVVTNPKNSQAIQLSTKRYQQRFPGFQIQFAIQDQELGTGDAVRSALPALKLEKTDSVVVLCGDAPLIREQSVTKLLETHQRHQHAVTVLSGIVADASGYGRIVRGPRDQSELCRIVEQQDASEEEQAIREINSGCFAIRAAHLESLLASVPAASTGEYHLTRMIDLALARSLKVAAVLAMGESEVLGINTRKQLAQATQEMKTRIHNRHLSAGVTIVDPNSAFIGPYVAIGQDTTIEPWVVIEGDVQIGRDCKIGPFACIRGNCSVADGVAVGNFVQATDSGWQERPGSRS